MKCYFAPTCFSAGLLVLLVCLAGPTWGQARPNPPVSPATHRITYTADVSVAGTSQADLLLRARAYTQRLGSANKSLLITNKSGAEELRAKSVRPFAYVENGRAHVIALHFTTWITVRAGSYTYQLTDFDLVYPVNTQHLTPLLATETFYTGRTKANHESFTEWLVIMRICCDEAFQEVLAQLQEDMSKPTKQTGDK